MITYNHEPFIAQAIESVLAQKTTFPYELVIGEDCSTDRTREIVLSFRDRHPHAIRVLLPGRNLGAHGNFDQTHRACRGQYIALLEGDDYWNDPEKLQKQIDFLDNHPECAICFSNAEMFFEDGSRSPEKLCPANQKSISTLDDLLRGNFIPTCSCLFRNGLFGDMPPWFRELGMGDWPLHILNAQHGSIGYLNETMAAYRVHPGGMWYGARTDLLKTNLALLKVYESLETHLGRAHQSAIRRHHARILCRTAHLYLGEGDIAHAGQFAQELLKKGALVHAPWSFAKLLAKLHLPGFLGLARTIRQARANAGAARSITRPQ